MYVAFADSLSMSVTMPERTFIKKHFYNIKNKDMRIIEFIIECCTFVTVYCHLRIRLSLGAPELF